MIKHISVALLVRLRYEIGISVIFYYVRTAGIVQEGNRSICICERAVLIVYANLLAEGGLCCVDCGGGSGRGACCGSDGAAERDERCGEKKVSFHDEMGFNCVASYPPP